MRGSWDQHRPHVSMNNAQQTNTNQYTPSISFDFPNSTGEEREGLKQKIRFMIARRFASGDIQTAAWQEKIKQATYELLLGEKLNWTQGEVDRFCVLIALEQTGLGILQPLLDDPAVEEVIVNGPNAIFVDVKGTMRRVPYRFDTLSELKLLINQIANRVGRRCDESTPKVDARLLDGSRVNATVEPICLCGATLNIRKRSDSKYTFERYQSLGVMSEEMAHFFRSAIGSRMNILISGGTSSGKTTLLNCFSGYIPQHERLISIEDSAELDLSHRENVVGFEARSANVEGIGEITIRDLIKNSLRMRPDRIIVGEVRGAEAIDLLTAMNSGHDGSISTIHANDTTESLIKLETYVGFGTQNTSASIRQTIAFSVQLIVQVAKLLSGKRVITGVSYVTGYDYGLNKILVQDIFRYNEQWDIHELVHTPEELIHQFRVKGFPWIGVDATC